MTEHPRPGRFQFTVNGELFSTNDPAVRGRDLLDLASRSPTDEYILFQLRDGEEPEDINLTEPVKVREAGVEAFLAFRTDRVFYFKVDERRYPWGEASITETQIREIARVPADRVLWLERRGNEADHLLESGETIALDAAGLERLYMAERPAEPVLVTVYLDGAPKQITAGDYTTETLKAALGVAARLDLDFIDPTNALIPLESGQPFTVKAGQKYVSHERQGGSS